MSKQNKKYKVESKKIDSLKWDDLLRASQESSVAVNDIGGKLVSLVSTIKNETDDIELFKLIDGVSNSIISIKNKIEQTSRLHGKDDNGVFKYFTGTVNIDNKNHSSLYINLINVYMDIGRIISEEIADKGITVIMERYNTVMKSKEK